MAQADNLDYVQPTQEQLPLSLMQERVKLELPKTSCQMLQRLMSVTIDTQVRW